MLWYFDRWLTHWPAIYDDRRGDPDYKDANKFWRREIGDPANGKSRLEAISPVNFSAKITAPLLIIQNKEKNRTVPAEQAKRMIPVLEKDGIRRRALFFPMSGSVTATGTSEVKSSNASRLSWKPI